MTKDEGARRLVRKRFHLVAILIVILVLCYGYWYFARPWWHAVGTGNKVKQGMVLSEVLAVAEGGFIAIGTGERQALNIVCWTGRVCTIIQGPWRYPYPKTPYNQKGPLGVKREVLIKDAQRHSEQLKKIRELRLVFTPYIGQVQWYLRVDFNESGRVQSVSDPNLW